MAPRWVPWAIVLAPVTILAVAAGAAFLSPAPEDPAKAVAAERQALQAYVGETDPLATRGGQIVQEGLKAGVNDIAQGRFTDAELVAMADGWVGELGQIRAQWDAVVPPAFLADAHTVYLQALDGYVETAEILRAAAGAQGDRRIELVDQAASMGERTDDLYERARSMVNDQRGRLGLPLDSLPGE